MPENTDLDAKMKRLETARTKVDKLKGERQKLEGKIEAQKKSIEELEKKCKEQFECGLEELPELAKNLEAEAEQMLKKAEGILEGKSE